MGSLSQMPKRRKGMSASDDPVLGAAHEAILEIGLGRLTLAEVARRAGVSRMTVSRAVKNHESASVEMDVT